MTSNSPRTFACPCGRYHEANHHLARRIDEEGRCAKVPGIGGIWWVPLIYMDNHDVRAEELKRLAYEYQWEPVTERWSPA